MTSKPTSHNIMNIEIFDGSQDFVIWKKKMLSVLVYHGLDAAVEDDWPTGITYLEKGKVKKKAYHTILLHLSDDVLTAVSEFTNASDLWKGLENLYLVKDVSNRLLSLHKLFGFKFATNKTVIENLAIFKRLVQDHDSRTKEEEERLTNEYLAIILLHSLLETYAVVKEFVSFNKEGLTTKVIMDALKFRSVGEEIVKTESEGLFLNKASTSHNNQNTSHNNHSNKGKSKKSNSSGNKNKNNNQAKNKNKTGADRKCYYCGKTNHLIKDCFKKKKDESNGKQKQIASSSVAELDGLTYKGLTAVLELSDSLIVAKDSCDN